MKISKDIRNKSKNMKVLYNKFSHISADTTNLGFI